MSLSITFDLEDNRRDPAQPPRFVAMTQRFLDFLDERGVKATVFIKLKSRPKASAARLISSSGVPTGVSFSDAKSISAGFFSGGSSE